MNEVRKAVAGVNPLLILTLSLLISGIAGFVVGQSGPIASSVEVQTGIDPTRLSAVDEYIVTGFKCPSPACPSCELKTCGCEESQRVREKVKQELAQGKDGSVVRQELMVQYGSQLKMGAN